MTYAAATIIVIALAYLLYRGLAGLIREQNEYNKGR